ncbi:MAG: hypothetical protein AAGC68_13240, partial [Verrucomicrobiota bacterium]
ESLISFKGVRRRKAPLRVAVGMVAAIVTIAVSWWQFSSDSVEAPISSIPLSVSPIGSRDDFSTETRRLELAASTLLTTSDFQFRTTAIR